MAHAGPEKVDGTEVSPYAATWRSTLWSAAGNLGAGTVTFVATIASQGAGTAAALGYGGITLGGQLIDAAVYGFSGFGYCCSRRVRNNTAGAIKIVGGVGGAFAAAPIAVVAVQGAGQILVNEVVERGCFAGSKGDSSCHAPKFCTVMWDCVKCCGDDNTSDASRPLVPSADGADGARAPTGGGDEDPSAPTPAPV